MSRQAPVVNRQKESKSTAVRTALLNPSKRQLSRWDRERRQRLILIGSAATLGLAVVLVILYGVLREMWWRPNEAAAYVYNEKIALGSLVERIKPQVAALDNEIMRIASGGQSPFGQPTTPGQSSQEALQRQIQTLQTQRYSAADQVLQDMIDEELIRLELERRGQSVTPDEITARINQDLARSRIPPAGATATEPAATPAAAPGAAPGATPSPTLPPTLTAASSIPPTRNCSSASTLPTSATAPTPRAPFRRKSCARCWPRRAPPPRST